MNGIEQDRKELLDLMIKEAYFQEKIILSSGKESDYYIDARRVTLDARGAYLSARMVVDIVGDDLVDAIGGPTLGADPMIGAVSVLRLQAGKAINTFIIRKAAKAHGKQQQVEGPILREGSSVVLIDDVATTGKAFIESLAVLGPMGIRVHKAICLVDRGEGAKEAVEAKGCELVSVFDISEIHKI
ncbi:Orotate phosphoribosyltransferase [hydrothermal vent metagenome]|uniref:orotate phosphoribosyltransferase n=1 Tax=hydrothermal vent metagenome TaxID=652676 RepID=A0A3B1E240_9ZZZZ